jgi:hypothetical protein
MMEEPKQKARDAQGKEEEDNSWWGNKVKEFFLENPTLVLSLLYLYVTALGIFYSAALYTRFGINIFDYSEISDFLLAALKNPWALVPAGILVFGVLVARAYETLLLPARPRSNNGRDAAEAPAELRRRKELERYHARSYILVQVIVYATVFVLFSLVTPYLLAGFKASSIKDGETAAVDVRYRSFSGSAGQVTEPGLALIGATQKVIFFYDVDDERTLVVPQAQLVSIEVPE